MYFCEILHKMLVELIYSDCTNIDCRVSTNENQGFKDLSQQFLLQSSRSFTVLVQPSFASYNITSFCTTTNNQILLYMSLLFIISCEAFFFSSEFRALEIEPSNMDDSTTSLSSLNKLHLFPLVS